MTTTYLHCALAGALYATQTTTASFERLAGLSNGALNKLRTGNPAPGTLSKILHALPEQYAASVVIANCRDVTPEPWRDRLVVSLIPGNVLQEAPPVRLTPFEAAMEKLQRNAHRPAIVAVVVSMVKALEEGEAL